ncbi:unnamed protein product [Protopolystoma xenopodis]|uniref:Uncharacterized protein n=1 Tax=Protopolystoma xenopodis TaxID=117903 RepID=A0A3S5BMW3_9PLAT|nr:unnamed protein product [Protopolystoma xenopodis]
MARLILPQVVWSLEEENRALQAEYEQLRLNTPMLAASFRGQNRLTAYQSHVQRQQQQMLHNRERSQTALGGQYISSQYNSLLHPSSSMNAAALHSLLTGLDTSSNEDAIESGTAAGAPSGGLGPYSLSLYEGGSGLAGIGGLYGDATPSASSARMGLNKASTSSLGRATSALGGLNRAGLPTAYWQSGMRYTLNGPEAEVPISTGLGSSIAGRRAE